MSKEDHPNLHAVGFAVDITASLRERVRGNARKAGEKEVFLLLSDKLAEFVNEIDDMLNEKFGGE